MNEPDESLLSPGSRGVLVLSGLLAVVVILAFVDLSPGKPAVTRTAAVAALMAFWWVSGALPLAATALLPVVLFPALGVLSSKEVAAQYFNDTILLFLGGFLVALTMQRWDLHRRMALRLLLGFGVHPARLLLGFLCATFFVSMWMSNTATTMMMLPIVASVTASFSAENPAAKADRYGKGLLLAIGFAATVGGTATLVGTPANLSLVRILAIVFPEAPELTFSKWLLFAFPVAAILLFIAWLVLSLRFAGARHAVYLDPDVIREQRRTLGPVTYEQRVVFLLFALMALLWMTRVDLELGAITLPGWNRFALEANFVGDGTVAIAVALLLFLIPSRARRGHQVLDWETAKQAPWDIVLLFGGGFALAKAITSSGLADWIGHSLEGLGTMPPFVLVFVTVLAISLLTELASNTAVAEMSLPVLASLAVAVDLHPLLLMIPATLACSYAFMLPVATPPNAIIFATGKLRVIDMVKAGHWMNTAGVILVSLAIFLLGRVVFEMGDLSAPAWAHGIQSVQGMGKP